MHHILNIYIVDLKNDVINPVDGWSKKFFYKRDIHVDINKKLQE